MASGEVALAGMQKEEEIEGDFMKWDLTDFCASINDERIGIRTPFQVAGYIYATNGKVLIRVPATDEVIPAMSGKGKTPKKSVLSIIGKAQESAAAFMPLDKIKVEKIKCMELFCDDFATYCYFCGGTGKLSIYAGIPIAFHNIRILEKLPGIELGLSEPEAPQAFRCDGAIGVVMPCRISMLSARAALK